MDPKTGRYILSSLQTQRNIGLSISGVMILTNLILVIVLFQKEDHIILVPPQISQPIDIQGNRVSVGYLEEWTLFLAHLLWDVTESSVITQGQTLLRLVEPGAYGAIKERILQEHKRLQNDHVSIRFSPVECKIPEDQPSLTMDVVGDFSIYVGSSLVSTKRETHRFRYRMDQKGHLKLLTIEVLSS